MAELRLGVKVRPSRTDGDDDPGHLAVFWNIGPADSDKIFRGLGFRISDLPEEYQPKARWREFLFENKLPGYVKDDLGMLDDYLRRRSLLACGLWDVDDSKRSLIERKAAPGRVGFYSFNPGDHDDEIGETGEVWSCHNCVTWGTEVINEVVGEGTLPPSRQGRIKEVLTILRVRAANTEQAHKA